MQTSSRSSEKQKFCEVSVHHENIKAFSSALHLLQKVGKEMTIEIEPNLVTLRALNDTKSAFVGVEFRDQYFDSFHLAANLKTFSCKVNVKPICVIFRSLKGMRQLRIRAGMADSSEHELVFEIVLMNDITRTYRFRYVDCEVMSAVFDEERCSYVRAKPKLFSQLLNHIYQSPEVCMEAGAGVFSVRSFHKAVDGVQNSEGANARFMQTGLSVSIQEFDQYEYLSAAQSEELIFCVREVNAFLGYAEILDVPDFDLFFSNSGRAVKYSARQDDLFVASLILATIESPQHHRQMQQQQQQGQGQEQEQEQEQQGAYGDMLVSQQGATNIQADNAGTAGVFAAALGPEPEGSQPVNTFRRNARSSQVNSAFLKCTADDDDESAALPGLRANNFAHSSGGGGVFGGGDSSSGAAAQMRRKRFLDEASDED